MAESVTYGGLKVWVEGEAVRRDATVSVEAAGLRVGDRVIPRDSIFWTSRRHGLLMVFGRDEAVAVKGPSESLERMGRRLDVGGREGRGRASLPDAVTREVILLTAGVAAVGRVDGDPTRGLRLAVFTREGIHLLAGGEHLRLPWPLDEVRTERLEKGGRATEALFLRKGESRLRLLYLFPEERDRAVRIASRRPEDREEAVSEDEDPSEVSEDEDGSEVSGDAATEGPRDDSLELFVRREVAPPVRAELPRLHRAADGLPEAAAEGAERLSREARETAELGPHFFETHLLEIGEIALGPLLLRKSAASAADELVRAVEAMDAGELQEDARAAVANACARLLEVYRRELRRLLSARRAPSRIEREYDVTEERAERLRAEMQEPFDDLVPLFGELEDRQRALLERLEEVEDGPPGTEHGELDRALDEWQEALRRIDLGFESAWRGLLDRLIEVWEETLLPRLERASRLKRYRLPEWLRLTFLGTVVLLVVAAVMILLVW